MTLVHCGDCGFFVDGFSDDVDAMRVAWSLLREQVFEAMDEWNRSRRGIACVDRYAQIRPWAWYMFDAPDEITEMELNTQGHVLNTDPPMLEFDYLRKIGELSADELRRAKAAGYSASWVDDDELERVQAEDDAKLEAAWADDDPDDELDDDDGARGDS